MPTSEKNVVHAHLPSQVGFLFLRYVGDPKTLWFWFQNYVNDEEASLAASSNQIKNKPTRTNSAGHCSARRSEGDCSAGMRRRLVRASAAAASP